MELPTDDSLLSSVQGFDTQEADMKSRQAYDAAISYSPQDVDCSITSVKCSRSSAVKNELGHPMQRGSQDALGENEFLPNVGKGERNPEANEKPKHAIYLLDWQELENGDKVDWGSPLKRKFGDVFDHGENEIRSAAGNTNFLSRSNTTDSSATLSSTLTVMGQWKAQDNDAESVPDEKDRCPKRPRSCPELERPLRLACPYHKMDPRKYNIHSNRTCASRHWDCVSRVKEHLYRCHLASPHCERCKEVFKTNENLQTHLVDPIPCSFKAGDPPDGISSEQQKALKKRNTTGQSLPQSDRWKEIYQILFPGHEIPDPSIFIFGSNLFGSQCKGLADCILGFDPVQELIDLGDFEIYFRQEIPKLVRSGLELQASREQTTLDDMLVSQTVEAIQHYQNLVLSNYRARLALQSSVLENSNNAPTISAGDSSSTISRSSTTTSIPPETACDSGFEALRVWHAETCFGDSIFEHEWNPGGTEGAGISHELSLEEFFP